MAKTYLDIINIALRDVNEVPLTQSSFDAPRGIQAAVKEMVNRAYLDVLNYSEEWPFLSTDRASANLSVDTVTSQRDYAVDVSIDNIDWDSFHIVSDDSSYAASLQQIEIDFYNRHLKTHDIDNPDGSRPLYVFRNDDNQSFGVTPIPDDKGYTITFGAWDAPNILVNSDDEIVIPDRFYNVLLSRVRYYLWMFRENPQQASFAQNEYNLSVKQMHRDLVDRRSPVMRAV